MPKKNGYEVAAFVKEHPTLAHMPVLLLAGAFEPVDEERAKRVKCDGVLVKPFEPHEVITRVRELLDARSSEPSRRRRLVSPAPQRGAGRLRCLRPRVDAPPGDLKRPDGNPGTS